MEEWKNGKRPNRLEEEKLKKKNEQKKEKKVKVPKPPKIPTAMELDIQYVKDLKESLKIDTSVNDIELKPYWMIHRGEQSIKERGSVKVYWRKEDALQHLVVLTEKNPGSRFYLLETVQVFRTKHPEVEKTLEFKDLKK